MATYATRAIIIGRYNFGEADRILVLLTPDRGIIRGVAKGVRKIKSRLAGHLELFSESDLMLAEGRNLDVVTAARLQRHFATGDDYDRMRLAYLIAEMINRLGGETQPYEGLFELAQEAFTELAAGRADATLELWFKLRLLDRLGYRPELGSCMVCGTADPQRSYLFNVELGGIVDQGCASVSGSVALSHDAIKLWRLMLAQPLTRIRSLAAAPELAKATLPICNAFYDYTFGKRFRSSEALT
jgi:DNA repair protein RecO (recombination protein O)